MYSPTYPCLYKVNLCYEGDMETIETEVVHGLIYAASYSDAAHQLEDYYGNELTTLEITLFEDGLIEIPENNVELIRKILEEKNYEC